MSENIFFLTRREKLDFIENKANEFPEAPISFSKIYIGVPMADIDSKNKILNILDAETNSLSVETYEDNDLYNIETVFPEISKGEEFLGFIKNNFEGLSVEVNVIEECVYRYKCTFCNKKYKDLDTAYCCHYEDCREQLLDVIETMKDGKKESDLQ